MPSPSIRCRQCGYQFALDSHDMAEGQALCRQCGATVPIRGVGGRQRMTAGKSGSGSTLYIWIIAAIVLALFLMVGCCGGAIYYLVKSVGPADYPEQTQDYADARKGFQTTLVQAGKSPQAWNPVTPPAGVSEVTYTSGGLKLKAWVNRPAAGEAPKPAVVFLHGGFAFDAQDWDQCQPFRDAGFVTMTPILRGENGQPGSYTLFYDEVDDALAAAEALAATPGVDPNRIYVAGHSAGGTLAMLAAMTSPRFKACAAFSGSPDQVTFVRDEPGAGCREPAGAAAVAALRQHQ